MSRNDHDLVPPRYRNPELVASGGMGDVYRAVDEVLDRTVAIKTLGEQYAADASVRKRFRHEALAAARLSGEPDTVTIFDVGEWQGTPFIVMEYLAGGTLRRQGEVGAARAVSRARLARPGGGLARRRPSKRRRPPRREAVEPPAGRTRRPSRRRLRDRHCGGARIDHARGHRPRHSGLPVAGAGSGPDRDCGDRPLCARGRRLRAPHRTTPVREGHPDGRGRRPSSRPGPARKPGQSRAAAERRQCFRDRPVEEPAAALSDLHGLRRRASPCGGAAGRERNAPACRGRPGRDSGPGDALEKATGAAHRRRNCVDDLRRGARGRAPGPLVVEAGRRRHADERRSRRPRRPRRPPPRPRHGVPTASRGTPATSTPAATG